MKLIREIKVKDLLLNYLLTLILILIEIFIFILLKDTIKLYILIPICLIVLYILLKYHVIGMVLMYKAFAPMDIKTGCRFHPTCSTYMILAIKKYGLFIGLIKGIKRLLRCKHPNGGVDFP